MRYVLDANVAIAAMNGVAAVRDRKDVTMSATTFERRCR